MLGTRANQLLLSSIEPPPMSGGPRHVTARPGKAVVEMSPFLNKIGTLLLPDEAVLRLRPHVGRIIAVSPALGPDGEPLPLDMSVGDVVLVRPLDGSWYRGFIERDPAPAYAPVGLRPLAPSQGDRVIVEVDEADRVSGGGILIPDLAQKRPTVGTVVSSATGSSLGVGQRIVFALSGGQPVEWEGKTYLSVTDEQIFCVLAPGAWEPENELRFYGVGCQQSLYQVTQGEDGDPSDYGLSSAIDLTESIVAKLIGESVRPITGNLLLKVIESVKYSFLVLERNKVRQRAQILAAGEKSGFRKLTEIAWKADEDLDLYLGFVDSEDLVIISESRVLAEIEE